jgi:hypothetical protein
MSCFIGFICLHQLGRHLQTYYDFHHEDWNETGSPFLYDSYWKPCSNHCYLGMHKIQVLRMVKEGMYLALFWGLIYEVSEYHYQLVSWLVFGNLIIQYWDPLANLTLLLDGWCLISEHFHRLNCWSRFILYLDLHYLSGSLVIRSFFRLEICY